MGLSPQRNLPPKLKKFNLAPLPTKGHRQMPFCFIKIIFPKLHQLNYMDVFFLTGKTPLKPPPLLVRGKQQQLISFMEGIIYRMSSNLFILDTQFFSHRGNDLQ